MGRRVVLVTGGAGFIGSHLVDSLLADGWAVRVLDDLSTGQRANLDSRAELVVADVADRSVLAGTMTGVAGVFHLAAIASVVRGNEDWPGTHRVNQSATIAVFDAARTAGVDRGSVPVVYASSAAIYGDTNGAPAHEGLPPDPTTGYGADKLGSELHARVGSLVHGVPTLGLRFFNVYGPRQDPTSPYSGVISIFSRRIAEGLPIVLNGDGEQTRDFVHVTDVVAHLRAAMQRLAIDPSLRGKALNVCTGNAVSIRRLAALLGEIKQQRVTIQHGPTRNGDIRHSLGCAKRATGSLRVYATVKLADGLATLSEPNAAVTLMAG